MRIYCLVCIVYVLSAVVSCSGPDVGNSTEPNAANHRSDQSKQAGNGTLDTTPEENNNVSDSGGTATENEPLPEELTKLIKELKIPVYEGNEPPTIDGYYHVTGTVVASKEGRLLGSMIDDRISLWKVSRNRMGFEAWLVPSKGQGWITGRNNQFTMLIHTTLKYDQECRYFSVISGRKDEEKLHTTSLVFFQNPLKCPLGKWEQADLVWKPTEKPTEKPTKPEEKENNEEPKNPHNPPPPPPLPPFP